MAKTRRFNILLTFDVDADSSVHGAYSGRPDELVARSKGQFGPRVGLARLLDLLEKHSIRSTFFVPGWTAETYPENVKEIAHRGHEVGVHGYKHENLAQLNSREDEEEIFRKSIDCLQALTGQRPFGFRAPDWEFSPYTMENLARFNLRYDSSLMDREEPYVIKSSGIVELPVAWSWDDWQSFEVQRRYPNEVFDNWIQEFNALQAVKVPYFNLTMHPQTIGRASRISMLDNLIETMRKRQGVRFSRCIDLVKEITGEN
jgi:peptidoglycan/xylan/chitin deacetylase (PgdA/CDA1 family)